MGLCAKVHIPLFFGGSPPVLLVFNANKRVGGNCKGGKEKGKTEPLLIPLFGRVFLRSPGGGRKEIRQFIVRLIKQFEPFVFLQEKCRKETATNIVLNVI